MGILRALGLAPSPVVEAAVDMTSIPSWSGDVSQVESLPADVAAAFDINVSTVRLTRRQAMRCTAVRRGRNLIAGPLGTARLVATRSRLAPDGAPVLADPGTVEIRRTFLEQPDPDIALPTLLTWTVDDLIFYPVAWWRVTARRPDGFPGAIERVAPWRVQITPEGVVLVDSHPVPDQDMIRFDGPDEGLLYHSSDAIRTAMRLEAATSAYADNPVPTTVLKDRRTGDVTPMSDDEIDSLLSGWETSRRRHTTAYASPYVDVDPISFNAEQIQLVEGRQRATVEIANALNLRAEALNTPGGGSLTYTNTQSGRSELAQTLAPYAAAIGGRLSMGDVTPNGQTVTVDLGSFLAGTEAERIANASAAVSGGLMSRDEARARYLGLPPATDLDTAPDQQPDQQPDPQPDAQNGQEDANHDA